MSSHWKLIKSEQSGTTTNKLVSSVYGVQGLLLLGLLGLYVVTVLKDVLF